MRKKMSFLPAAAALAVLAGLAVWLTAAVNNTGRASAEQQLNAVRDSVENGITLCYSIEGAYPESLEYLENSYGVVYDRDKYLVHYEFFAGNVRPSVAVVERAWD